MKIGSSLHHKRRYRLPELLEKLHRADLTPKQHFYFNYLLFVPILATHYLMHVLHIKVATEGELNTKWLNGILLPVFRLDVRTAAWLRPPIGVSALVVATRN